MTEKSWKFEVGKDKSTKLNKKIACSIPKRLNMNTKWIFTSKTFNP